MYLSNIINNSNNPVIVEPDIENGYNGIESVVIPKDYTFTRASAGYNQNGTFSINTSGNQLFTGADITVNVPSTTTSHIIINKIKFYDKSFSYRTLTYNHFLLLVP